MANIYDLTEGIRLLWDLMDEGALDDGALEDAMFNSQEELNIKLEGYCHFIMQMESDIEGIAKEIKRLQDRKKVLENTIERSKKVMEKAMNVAGERKVKGKLFTISIQANPSKLVMDEQYLENIPKRYLIPQDPKVDKELIKEDLKSGAVLDGLAHLEQTESLRIR